MPNVDDDFKNRVYHLVAAIPEGRVMTYGQIAVMAGHPRAARIVGQIAHFGPIDLPWHRVVNKNGGLAAAFSFGGIEAHKRLLEEEGVQIIENEINNVESYLWRPEITQ